MALLLRHFRRKLRGKKRKGSRGRLKERGAKAKKARKPNKKEDLFVFRRVEREKNDKSLPLLHPQKRKRRHFCTTSQGKASQGKASPERWAEESAKRRLFRFPRNDDFLLTFGPRLLLRKVVFDASLFTGFFIARTHQPSLFRAFSSLACFGGLRSPHITHMYILYKTLDMLSFKHPLGADVKSASEARQCYGTLPLRKIKQSVTRKRAKLPLV